MQQAGTGSPFFIRAAAGSDAAALRELLRAASLPTDGVPDDLVHFLVAERDAELVGTIGYEHYGEAGLLRSAAVRPDARGSGVGESLVRALLEDARAEGLRTLVLLTTTAEEWFPRFGFTRIARDSVPAALHASAEFRGACPDSATVMRLSL